MINDWLQQVMFEVRGLPVTLGSLVLVSVSLIGLVVFHRFAIQRWLGDFFRQKNISPTIRKKTRRLTYFTIFLTIAYLIFLATEWNPMLWKSGNYALNLGHFLAISVLWSWVQLINLLVVQIFFFHVFEPAEQQLSTKAVLQKDMKLENSRSGKSRLELLIFYTAILFSLSILNADLSFFEGTIGKWHLSLRLSQILVAVWVFIFARVAVWVIVHFLLSGVYRRRQINIGMQFAINQLLNYLIFFFALLFALNLIGVNMTLIASGAAALLLGVGLGLQQTFNDFFSGLILLFERSVEVGDIVEIDGLVGKVRRIGLRMSIVQTRDNRSVIVPNSKLVVNNVTNWSHDDEIARFAVSVGVAYGSDTAKVKQILLDAARQHPKVLEHPEPLARFTNFGESSLDFEILFWSEELMRIEDVKSDLRFVIDQAFREHSIVIPFPQRDLWLRNFPPSENPA